MSNEELQMTVGSFNYISDGRFEIAKGRLNDTIFSNAEWHHTEESVFEILNPDEVIFTMAEIKEYLRPAVDWLLKSAYTVSFSLPTDDVFRFAMIIAKDGFLRKMLIEDPFNYEGTDDKTNPPMVRFCDTILGLIHDSVGAQGAYSIEFEQALLSPFGFCNDWILEYFLDGYSCESYCKIYPKKGMIDIPAKYRAFLQILILVGLDNDKADKRLEAIEDYQKRFALFVLYREAELKAFCQSYFTRPAEGPDEDWPFKLDAERALWKFKYLANKYKY